MIAGPFEFCVRGIFAQEQKYRFVLFGVFVFKRVDLGAE
jgi:hypothetical protein